MGKASFEVSTLQPCCRHTPTKDSPDPDAPPPLGMLLDTHLPTDDNDGGEFVPQQVGIAHRSFSQACTYVLETCYKLRHAFHLAG